MKRTIFLLLGVAVVFGVAGWGAAQIRNARQDLVRAENEQRLKLAAEQEARRPAKYFAELAAQADLVEMDYVDGEEEKTLRFRDPDWVKRVAAALADGSYHQELPGLWSSSASFTFCKNGALILSWEMGPSFRAYPLTPGDKPWKGDFGIDRKTTAALCALILEKLPPSSGASH